MVVLTLPPPPPAVQMAVASTDTGHNNSGIDSKFGINNDESLIDFGYRAVHLTTVYSKKILEASLGPYPRACTQVVLIFASGTGLLRAGPEDVVLARMLVGRQTGAQGGPNVPGRL